MENVLLAFDTDGVSGIVTPLGSEPLCQTDP